MVPRGSERRSRRAASAARRASPGRGPPDGAAGLGAGRPSRDCRSRLNPVPDRHEARQRAHVIVQPEDVSDTVSMYGHIRNRAEIQEPKGQEGVAALLDRLLTYGSERFDRVAFQEQLDAIGAKEKAGTDFSTQVLGSTSSAPELLADNELKPAVPNEALQVNPGSALSVAARNTSPGFLTQRSLRTALFPPQDPSLRMSTPETVRALNSDAVRAYYHSVFRSPIWPPWWSSARYPRKRHARPSRSTSVVARQGALPDIDLGSPFRTTAEAVDVVPDSSRVQDRVVLAQTLALEAGADADYYPLELGNAVLGGSFYATRLSIDLRKNAGLGIRWIRWSRRAAHAAPTWSSMRAIRRTS